METVDQIGVPFTPPVMGVDIQLAGYREAAARFHAGMYSPERGAASIPLYEALAWVVGIDTRLQEAWKETGNPPRTWWSDSVVGGDTVRGLRFVRNRVQHQWALAMYVSRDVVQPEASRHGFEWRWVPARYLPPGGNRSFQNEYDMHLAGRDVASTLGEVGDAFSAVVSSLVAGP